MRKISAVLVVLFSAAAIVSASTQIKVSCVGNSITAGKGSDTNYVVRLQKLLGSSYLVENDGKTGTTLLKHGDCPYWTHDKFPAVFAFKPAIITIKLGSNDTKPPNWDKYNGEFKTDLLSMIDTFGTIATKPKIYLVFPVPSWPNEWGIRDSVGKLINVIIKQVASERSLPYIDCHTPLVNFKQYFPDGVHPDDPGADTIARTIYRALTTKTPIANTQPASPPTTATGIREKQGKLFVTLPFSGRTVVEAFDLCGKRLCSQTFDWAGIFALNGISGYQGVSVVRIKNPSFEYTATESVLKR